MAERQTKGFYQNLESEETFAVGVKDEKKNTVKSDDKSIEGFIMNIGLDAQKNQKVFLHKSSTTSRLTGNPWLDSFTKFNDYLIEHSKITVKETAVIFRLLSTMINAGIPLIKSLNTLGAQSEKNVRLQRVLFDMAHEVEIGSSLSKAMEKYSDVFTIAQIGSVQAGEASGQLNKTFKNMAEEAEKAASISAKVKGAMVYPVVILCLMFGVVFLMMVMVVPSISKLYVEAGKELPTATKILIKMSDFSVAYWWLIIIGVFAFVSAFLTWKKTQMGRYYWDLFLINVPIFGDLVKKSTLAKFSYGFGNLLSSGVPIIKAIEIVSLAVGNEVYRKRFLLTAEDMKSGIPMAENLSNSKLFPSMLVNMIEVGEQTAQLENVTQKVAEFYNEEVNTSVNSLTKIMEPLIIVVMGVVVGGLVAAIMMPIIQLTDISGTL